MENDDGRKWSIMLDGVSNISHDRCKDDVKPVADQLGKLLDACLKIDQERDTTVKTAEQVRAAILAAYQLGRTNQRLYTVTLK